jgi:ketosteroid isomerase-like protein
VPANTESDPAVTVVMRLRDAINAHDLDAMVDCFAPDFRGETPTTPDNSFTGHENVRRNWGMILSRIPDLTFEIVRITSDGDTAWAEVEQRGTMPDGSQHLHRGVMLCRVADGRMVHNRLYIGPVVDGPPPILDN